VLRFFSSKKKRKHKDGEEDEDEEAMEKVTAISTL